MESGIAHHKPNRKSCVLPTADRNTRPIFGVLGMDLGHLGPISGVLVMGVGLFWPSSEIVGIDWGHLGSFSRVLASGHGLGQFRPISGVLGMDQVGASQ